MQKSMEHTYFVMKGTGVLSLVIGIVILIVGIMTGVLAIVSGAILLRKKSDLQF